METEQKPTHTYATVMIDENIKANSIEDAISQIAVILNNAKLDWPLDSIRLRVFGFVQSITVPIEKVVD